MTKTDHNKNHIQTQNALQNRSKRKMLPIKTIALSTLFIVLAGCGSIQPEPFTQDEIKARAEQDRLRMYADQEPITKPISFNEAAARALKYNLDYKLKLLEHTLATNLHDVSTHEMLPRLVANAGYVNRNNDSGGRSIGIEDGIQTLRPSTSQQRERNLADLSLSWNVLDFGVSYYRAQQKADQVLMAEERRRKVAQNVMQDVRNSYWRALGAQKLISRVDQLIARVNHALTRAREIERKDLMPRPEILAYQRTLLDAVNLLTLRRQDLELSRAELRALMSISPDVDFELADEAEQKLPAPPKNIQALEIMALEHRPEIMEEWYRKRITENDIKAITMSVFPNLSFDTGFHYDSNKYNYNANWMDVGVRLSWNILKLAQLPALYRAHDYQNETDDMRRLALSMAVLTQVRVGVQRYGLSLSELQYAQESARVDRQLLHYAQASKDSEFQSELEVIRAQARYLLAEYQRYASYSNAQAAWGRLYNSVGLDVLPETIESHDLETLARAIGQTNQEWQSIVFDTPRPVTSVVHKSNSLTASHIETDRQGQPVGRLRGNFL